jgi:hypothetical protein
VHLAGLWGVLEGLQLARAHGYLHELNTSCEALFTNKDREEKNIVAFT